nr:hypothetical protein [Tanacetum cinerariifolium]
MVILMKTFIWYNLKVLLILIIPENVKDYLGKYFAMKDLGEATFILGIKIYRDRSKRLIRLGQNAYMDKILKRYKMDNSKRVHIPMQERIDLNKTQGASTPKEVKRMQNIPYALVVGSIYNPGECQWTAVKKIINYLRTKDMFLVYGGNPKAELRVDCYYDAEFETEAEYIAASEAAMKVVWIRKFILELDIVPTISLLECFAIIQPHFILPTNREFKEEPDTTMGDIIMFARVLQWAK